MKVQLRITAKINEVITNNRLGRKELVCTLIKYGDVRLSVPINAIHDLSKEAKIVQEQLGGKFISFNINQNIRSGETEIISDFAIARAKKEDPFAQIINNDTIRLMSMPRIIESKP